MVRAASVVEAEELKKQKGQQPPLLGVGHHCRAAVHLDAIVLIPTAARNQVSDPKESEHHQIITATRIVLPKATLVQIARIMTAKNAK